jgi:uncharacterized protein (TIGR03437 family)
MKTNVVLPLLLAAVAIGPMQAQTMSFFRQFTTPAIDQGAGGQGAILNQDGTFNSPSNPAQRGSTITMFGTGGGEADPGVVDGQIVAGVRPRTNLPVSVMFDLRKPSEEAEVQYAGGVFGSVAGVLQLNVRVPSNAHTGDAVHFKVVIGAQWTGYQATVALR